MAQFTVNTHRLDPYKDFKFRVRMDGEYVAGISRVSPLHRTTEVVTHRAGGDLNVPHRSPGRTSFSPVTFERGVTHDPEFEDWAGQVVAMDAGSGSEVALKDYRRDLTLELLNEAGQIVLAYRLYRCWVSEYRALPELDANGAASVAIERLTVECEGWDRDRAVTEPAEPSRA